MPPPMSDLMKNAIPAANDAAVLSDDLRVVPRAGGAVDVEGSAIHELEALGPPEQNAPHSGAAHGARMRSRGLSGGSPGARLTDAEAFLDIDRARHAVRLSPFGGPRRHLRSSGQRLRNR